MQVHLQGVSDSDTYKAWICLFTCCVTQAVHLKLVLDMSAPTFIRYLKHFTARSGLPPKFISDNGKLKHLKQQQRPLRKWLSNRNLQLTLPESGLNGRSIWKRPPGGEAYLKG